MKAWVTVLRGETIGVFHWRRKECNAQMWDSEKKKKLNTKWTINTFGLTFQEVINVFDIFYVIFYVLNENFKTAQLYNMIFDFKSHLPYPNQFTQLFRKLYTTLNFIKAASVCLQVSNWHWKLVSWSFHKHSLELIKAGPADYGERAKGHWWWLPSSLESPRFLLLLF